MNPVVSAAEWRAARVALLAQEKALTRARDAVNAARAALPWVRVDKPYAFATAQGERTLGELFQGRSQLIVQHFMFAPEWTEGCVGCSLWADHVDAALPHLAAGRAEYNYRPGGSGEMPGHSAFYRDSAADGGAGAVFHTYSAYARGVEEAASTYMLLDIAPLGRNEAGLPAPMAWVRHHDRYDDEAGGCCAT